MVYSTDIELNQLEKQLEKIVPRHNDRVEMWWGHVAKHINKYGLPIMYVGQVDLAYKEEASAEKIVWQSRQMSFEKRAEFLRDKVNALSSAFPDALVALFKDKSQVYPDILLLGKRCIEVENIVSYHLYHVQKEDFYSFIDVRCKAPYSSRITTANVIFKNETESNEAVSVLEYVINGKEFDYPKKIIDSSKVSKDAPNTHPSFFGNSLLRPSEELKERLSHQGFSDDRYFYLVKEIGGVPFNFVLYSGKESHLIINIIGYSEQIQGYENARKVFDAFVEILKEEYGAWGIKLTDIPEDIRKNSIVKGLREGTITVKAEYTFYHFDIDPSKVSIEMCAFNGQNIQIKYHLYDSQNDQASIIAHEEALAKAKLKKPKKKKRRRKRRDDY